MPNPHRQLRTHAALNVDEVGVFTLRGLWTQVDGLLVFRDPPLGFKHQIELTNRGEFGFPAFGTRNLVILQCFGEFVVRQPIRILFGRFFEQVIGTKAAMAILAIDQRVIEARDMTGSNPHFGVHQNGGIDAVGIGDLLDEKLPPQLLDVVFQFDTQRTIVPGVGQSPINFRPLEDESIGLRVANEFFHFHCAPLVVVN